MTLPKEGLPEEDKLPVPECILQSVLANNHYFATYLGYQITTAGILVQYQCTGPVQTMVLDAKTLQIKEDSTFSTKKVLDVAITTTRILSRIFDNFNQNSLDDDYDYED